MNYDDRTVVEYAEHRLKAVRSQRLVFPIMGGLFVAFVICLVWMVRQESDKLGELLVANRVFWAGFGVGVLFLSMLFLCAFGLVKSFRMSWGIEAAVYELAVRRGHENSR